MIVTARARAGGESCAEPLDKDSPNGGANAASLIRRAALWVSPIVIATAIVVSDKMQERRALEDNTRDIAEIRDQLDRVRSDVSDRMQFVDRDGIRDPVVRMALDRHVADLLRQMNVLTRQWALRLHDRNNSIILPEE
jgi:hypothetical protein